MSTAGLSRPAIDSFHFHFDRLHEGDDGLLAEKDIDAVASLPAASDLEDCRESGKAALERTVVIKLNGGLGTGMGLDEAKSLLMVRDGLSFLDLIARQVLSLRSNYGAQVPLILMNSFRTNEQSTKALDHYPTLEIADIPTGFLQNKVPKILAKGLLPAESPERGDLEWCPPGHGDLYTAIAGTGLLPRLIDRGIEYAFVSNADNLGAVVDTALLGYMVEDRIDFMLEAAVRTRADRKGGHLCRLANGRLALRESAQCPPEARSAFQDIERYSFFNSNNLWIHLPSLAAVLEASGGFLPLSTIVNRKNLDPRDPSSPAVLQLETAMGSAISLFEKATAVIVPRQRFSPVKNTNDLLATRSDAYDLTEDSRVVLHSERSSPPVISLDDRYFKMIDDFETRFPNGPPSLRRCDLFEVEGDVTFGAGVVAEGAVTIRADGPARVPDGTVIDRAVDL